jgi:hypothetical protein
MVLSIWHFEVLSRYVSIEFKYIWSSHLLHFGFLYNDHKANGNRNSKKRGRAPWNEEIGQASRRTKQAFHRWIIDGSIKEPRNALYGAFHGRWVFCVFYSRIWRTQSLKMCIPAIEYAFVFTQYHIVDDDGVGFVNYDKRQQESEKTNTMTSWSLQTLINNFSISSSENREQHDQTKPTPSSSTIWYSFPFASF